MSKPNQLTGRGPTTQPHIAFAPGPHQASLDSALEQLAEDQVVARLWKHDYTLWADAPTEITNRLGWLRTADAMLDNLDCLDALVDDLRAQGYTHALLMGMGGSSLAPEVFRKTFGVEPGYLDLAVLDSTDPAVVSAYAARLPFEKTLFIVATKSGGTAETLSFFKYFYNQTVQAVGEQQAGQHFIAITDPGTALTQLAADYDFRTVFLNDPNIGGRYSALSYFGLVAAALIGVDLEKLLNRALGAASDCGTDGEAACTDNPGALLGVILSTLAQAGQDKLTLVASPQVASFGDWVEQLGAESTGKQGTGILPVVGEPLGAPNVYGSDRLFVHLRLDGDETQDQALLALEEAGHPVVRVRLRDRYDLGRQFFEWEMATAIASHGLKINPFDQPNVESAKKRARTMIQAYREAGKLPDREPAPLNSQSLHAFLEQAAPTDYIALQAFVQPTPEMSAALLALRTRLRDTYRLATTVGYGPRFLHSTGQLHKGDAGNGLFVQFTSAHPDDVPIPDRAGAAESSISFGVLLDAQAQGDAQALLDARRRLIHFHLGTDLHRAVRQLAE
jgi:glucose-6-phosphate isomerase